MKNSELEQILKSAPVPDRPGAYWGQFPQRVMAKTNWLRTRVDAGAGQPQTKPFWLRYRFRFAIVGLGLAISGLLLCGPKGCQNYVTFSGQQIRLNGETCEVLLDHHGNVLLVGQRWIFSTAQASANHARYQVAAQPLEMTL